MQETEEDCTTEATTPSSFEHLSQTQTSTTELDESPGEEVDPSPEAVSPGDEDSSPVEEVIAQEEEARPADVAQPDEKDSEKREEPESSTDSSSQSVDELLADWREDLEAFKQMEKDEL